MRILAVALAVALGLTVLLGFRVVRLEQRVAALGKQLGVAEPAGAGSGGGSAPSVRGDHEQRLRVVERDVTALRFDLQTLEEATGEPAVSPLETPGGEQRILSVVERQQARIRDRQLAFHRARWLEWRQDALDNFAAMHGLSPVQTDRLYRLLADEVEALVALMKRPDFAENPDRAANDWLDVLETTNGAAHEILDPQQRAAWDAARLHERVAFWPWLPKD